MSKKAVTRKSSWNIFRLPARITNIGRKTKSLTPKKGRTDSARSPQLPLDVCELIIDILRDDPSTLSACSLACREWLYTIRSYRFSRVYLTDRNLTTFLDLLRFSPEIGSHVEHLLIKFAWSALYEPISRSAVDRDWQIQKFVRPMSDHLSQEAFLDEVCVHLQTVESLSLNGVIVTSSILSTLSRLTTVKTVEVGRAFILALGATSDELMAALPRAFPLLTQVIIKAPPHVDPSVIQVEDYTCSRLGLGVFRRRSAWYFDNDEDAHSDGRKRSPSVYMYTLRGTALVHSYVHGPSEVMRGARGSGLQAFLQGAGANIKDLSIHLYALMELELEVIESSLARCINLQSIGFYGLHLDRPPHMPIWISEFLSLVKTNGVRTICFHVYPTYEVIRWGLMGLRTLHTLQTVLVQERFRNLEKVIFYIDREDVRILVEEFVREEVPELESLLSFCTM